MLLACCCREPNKNKTKNKKPKKKYERIKESEVSLAIISGHTFLDILLEKLNNTETKIMTELKLSNN